MAQPSDDCTVHLAKPFDLDDPLAEIHGVTETYNQKAAGVQATRLL